MVGRVWRGAGGCYGCLHQGWGGMRVGVLVHVVAHGAGEGAVLWSGGVVRGGGAMVVCIPALMQGFTV